MISASACSKAMASDRVTAFDVPETPRLKYGAALIFAQDANSGNEYREKQQCNAGEPILEHVDFPFGSRPPVPIGSWRQ